MDWTEGYVAELGYTFGYYPELNPLRAQLALLASGYSAPECSTSCELGFGQGMSINVHAAASGTQWYGTDFNPAQAGFARELASASGADAKLFDESFAEFCSRPDLPEFDSIGLHGIWSWISDDNREVIVDFLRRKLKVGGLLYISYNTLPGWSSFAPLRHLMTEHAATFGSKGNGIVSRINGSLEFADKLLASQPSYLKANPQALERLKRVKDQNRSYLAHEYFNQDWHPMYFADMARWLSAAKLDFAGSAHYMDYLEALNLLPDQQALLKTVPNALFRESTRDYMVNQQFRRDYWVKGARRLSGTDQLEALRQQRVVLTSHRPDITNKVVGAQGEGTMSEALYQPILDLLSDHKVRSLAEIEQAMQSKNINFSQVVQAVLALGGSGHLAPAQTELQTEAARSQTKKLNLALLKRARGSTELGYLSSPVTGGALLVPRFQQLFLHAIGQGKKTPAEWAADAWQLISKQGQKVMKDGKTLETPEENLEELTSQANTFAQKQLPILKALQMV